MQTRFKLAFLFALSFSSQNFSATCPPNDNAPLCPTSGSTLLDETYPTQAFVISNDPRKKGLQSSKVTSKYIGSIAKSYNYEKVPQIFVPVTTSEDFLKIISSVKAQLEKDKVKPEIITQITSQIIHVPSTSYTWQQDYFESFVDLKTGRPVLREFESYLQYRSKTKNAVAKIQQVGKDCQITQGQMLKTQRSEEYHPTDPDVSFGSGEMGGNTEGAPGGFCLTGDNQSKKLSSQYCGNRKNIIQLQTSWLAVGHVDEIFKIIPSTFSDGRPNECQFSLMAASPGKALELMNKGTNKSRPFFSFSPLLTDEEFKEVRESRGNAVATEIICGYIEKSIKNGSFIPANSKQKLSPGEKGKSVFLKFFIDDAFSSSVAVSGNAKESFNCANYIDEVPTSIISDAMKKDNELINLNKAIQNSIDKDKELIKSQILSRLPQCAKFFDIVDVPDLFHGSPPIEVNGKLQLPKPGDVASFLPNPTNSVLMNKTILLPESGNSFFDSYIEEELKKRKLQLETIDTWDYSHVAQGNMHCSSHSIPYCKPR